MAAPVLRSAVLTTAPLLLIRAVIGCGTGLGRPEVPYISSALILHQVGIFDAKFAFAFAFVPDPRLHFY
jgi:hypothetical protein